jgi:hypothetical protein
VEWRREYKIAQFKVQNEQEVQDLLDLVLENIDVLIASGNSETSHIWTKTITEWKEPSEETDQWTSEEKKRGVFYRCKTRQSGVRRPVWNWGREEAQLASGCSR